MPLACVVMSYKVMACILMTYLSTACVVLAYMGMVYIRMGHNYTIRHSM